MPSKTIVAVLSDLMFTVKIQEAARGAGLEAIFVKTAANAFEKAKEGPAAIIIDLNSTDFDALQLIEQLKADTETRGVNLVGFISHVQIDRKRAAQEKGCDVVIARSAFSQKLPGLLKEYAGVE
jgi:CheY-like chemotaxis protein